MSKQRKRHTPEQIVRKLGQRLATYGVELAEGLVWRDYRHGALWGVIMTVLTSFGVEHTERGDRMFAAMAARHARHAIELDALDVLA